MKFLLLSLTFCALYILTFGTVRASGGGLRIEWPSLGEVIQKLRGKKP